MIDSLRLAELRTHEVNGGSLASLVSPLPASL